MKKKGKKKRLTAAEAACEEERREELLALSLIYGEDLQPFSDGSAFSLRVLPHPGEAETNHVAVTLNVRSETASFCDQGPSPVSY